MMSASPAQAPSEAPPLAAFDWTFLKRTARSALVTSLLVGLFSAVYGSFVWAGRYLLFSLWALAFFSLTALILRALALGRPRRRLALLTLLKLASLTLIFAVMWLWPVSPSETFGQGIAIVLGTVTPPAVLILRALGRLVDPSSRHFSARRAPAAAYGKGRASVPAGGRGTRA